MSEFARSLVIILVGFFCAVFVNTLLAHAQTLPILVHMYDESATSTAFTTGLTSDQESYVQFLELSQIDEDLRKLDADVISVGSKLQ